MLGQSVYPQTLTVLGEGTGVALNDALKGEGLSIADIEAIIVGVGCIVALGEDVGLFGMSEISGDGDMSADVVKDQKEPPLLYTSSPIRI